MQYWIYALVRTMFNDNPVVCVAWLHNGASSAPAL